VQVVDDERAAPLKASMLMNIMPILSRRRSAGIRHNIAQDCQAPSSRQRVVRDSRKELRVFAGTSVPVTVTSIAVFTSISFISGSSVRG
jgi:hypothetical protein